MRAASVAKNDEFYTTFEDIEKEVIHYKDHFKDKTVLCNCDDPHLSQFFNYFFINFKSLGLRKLIATCYKKQDIDLLSDYQPVPATYAVYTGKDYSSVSDIPVFNLNGDGDFRSHEVKPFLDEADIVVTNPPFSLFREFINLMVSENKKFLVLGNGGSVLCREIFPLFKNKKLWYGVSITSGDRKFYVPDNYELNASGCGVDSDGKRFIRVKGVRWFTNLPAEKPREHVVLTESYSPDKYRKFDNYDAINVNKTSEIPADYFSEIAVPITFLDKYDPNAGGEGRGSGHVTTNDFDIIGCFNRSNGEEKEKFCYIKADRVPVIEGNGKQTMSNGPVIDKKALYARIVIKRKEAGN